MACMSRRHAEQGPMERGRDSGRVGREAVPENELARKNAGHAPRSLRDATSGGGKREGPAPVETSSRDGEPKPQHFYLLNASEKAARKQMMRLVKERYRTERFYQDMKGELGL